MHEILIVEDDLGIRETIVDLLEMLGYKYREANNGKEALRLIENQQPDLILTDIMMPKMDGIELLQFLKSDYKYCTIPVLMLTAKTDIDTRLTSYKLGADGYLLKPFNMDELSYKIKNLIGFKENLIKKLMNPSEINNGPEWDFVQRLNEVLRKNISEISLELVADQMQLSKSGLQKKLKRFSDLSFQEYVRGFKLSRARALLESGKANVNEAAFLSGFKSVSHFSRAFREQFGSNPSQRIV